MKVLILADPDSIHTIKWVESLHKRGVEILLFGLRKTTHQFPSELKVVLADNITTNGSDILKLSYIKTLSTLKKVYREFQPDIVHAHYATSYGLLGAFLRAKIYCISVWGSDVYDFPNRSFIHRMILKFNLSRTQYIFSTSNDMARETAKYTSKKINVIPFGIDVNQFKPLSKENRPDLVVGTVKSLEKIYGIDLLIKAFYKLSLAVPNVKLKIAGNGSERGQLVELTKRLSLEDKVTFLGRVQHSKLPELLNGFDVFVALSRAESFGVSVIEASACEIPVVATRVGGLKEVVKDNSSGFLVDKENYESASEKLIILLTDNELREKMGKAGRTFCLENYNWSDNVSQMMEAYTKMLS